MIVVAGSHCWGLEQMWCTSQLWIKCPITGLKLEFLLPLLHWGCAHPKICRYIDNDMSPFHRSPEIHSRNSIIFLYYTSEELSGHCDRTVTCVSNRALFCSSLWIIFTKFCMQLTELFDWLNLGFGSTFSISAIANPRGSPFSIDQADAISELAGQAATGLRRESKSK